MKRLVYKQKNAVKTAFGALIAACFLISCASAGKDIRETDGDSAVNYAADLRDAIQAIEKSGSDETPNRGSREMIKNMVYAYGAHGQEADREVEGLLEELDSADPDAAARWGRIMAVWRSLDTELSIQYDVLPGGLPDTDELCIVALGFQLEPDGAMREELTERLEVVKNSAEKYPNAWIVCTGGGTAPKNPSATEAGRMAEWLVEQGIDSRRILTEDRSLTTAQNAIFTYALLSEKAPQVTKLAVISSDYQIAAGTLLFEAEAILQAEDPASQKMTVAANAACQTSSGFLSPMFQAGALMELFE